MLARATSARVLAGRVGAAPAAAARPGARVRLALCRHVASDARAAGDAHGSASMAVPSRCVRRSVSGTPCTGSARARFIAHAQPRPAGVRFLHTTSAAAGGRNDGNRPGERLKNWRKYLSKRAKKRHKRKAERTAKNTPRNQLAVRQKQLPPEAQMEEMREENIMLLDALKAESPAPLSPREELQQVDADELMRGLESGEVWPNSRHYVLLLRVLGAQGRFEDAMHTAQAMVERGVQLDTYAYAAMATVCANVGNPDAAFDIINMMREAGVPPTEHVYASAVKACVTANQLGRAFGTLRQMLDDGVTPDVVVFTTLMSGFNQAGLYDRAWSVWDYMRTHHCEPDVVAFSTMITTCAKTDEVERALNLFTEMKQLRMMPTHVTYNAVIYATARSIRRNEHAHQLFEEMRVQGFKPDVPAYNSILLACSHQGQINRAKEIMHRMYGDGLKPTRETFNVMLAVYARSMSRLKGKRGPPTVEERAEGKDLLKPPQHTQNVEELGHGQVLVDGEEDTIVHNLLVDYYNDPTKESYAGYMDALEDQRKAELARHSALTAVHPMAGRDVEVMDDIERAEYELKKIEAEKAAIDDPGGLFKGITAELDLTTYLSGSEDVDAVVNQVHEAIGDTDFDELSDGELLRRYEHFTKSGVQDAYDALDDVGDFVEDAIRAVEKHSDGEAAFMELTGGTGQLEVDDGVVATIEESRKLNAERRTPLHVTDGESAARRAAPAGEPDSGVISAVFKDVHRPVAGDGGYAGDDDELDGSASESESDADDLVGSVAAPGEVQPGLVRRRRAGRVTAPPAREPRTSSTTQPLTDASGEAPAGASAPSTHGDEAAGTVTDAPLSSSAVKPNEGLTLSPEAARALQDKPAKPGPGSSPGVNVEDAVVSAVESRMQRRIRGGAQPATLRALLAVHQLDREGVFKSAATEEGEDGLVAKRRDALGDALVPGSEQALRLQTLKRLARKFASGAHWLPSELHPEPSKARVNLVHEVKAVYRYMQAEHGIKPDLTTANTVLSAFCEAQYVGTAMKFFREEYPALELQPDARTYQALVKMHAKRKDMATATALKDELIAAGHKPTKDLMGALVHGHATVKDVRSSLDTLDEMFRYDLKCPEHYAFQLRETCKQMGIWHPLVPAHPVKWQFSKRVTKHRKAVDKKTRQTAKLMKAASFMAS